jgi:hypothetical protein
MVQQREHRKEWAAGDPHDQRVEDPRERPDDPSTTCETPSGLFSIAAVFCIRHLHFSGVRRLHREEPELFAVMGEVAQRSARDPAIAAIFKEMSATWHAALRGPLKHSQAEGAIDRNLEADAVASLVIATLRGMFMVPLATTSHAQLGQSLAQLERFIGLAEPARARPGAVVRRRPSACGAKPQAATRQRLRDEGRGA